MTVKFMAAFAALVGAGVFLALVAGFAVVRVSRVKHWYVVYFDPRCNKAWIYLARFLQWSFGLVAFLATYQYATSRFPGIGEYFWPSLMGASVAYFASYAYWLLALGVPFRFMAGLTNQKIHRRCRERQRAERQKALKAAARCVRIDADGNLRTTDRNGRRTLITAQADALSGAQELRALPMVEDASVATAPMVDLQLRIEDAEEWVDDAAENARQRQTKTGETEQASRRQAAAAEAELANKRQAEITEANQRVWRQEAERRHWATEIIPQPMAADRQKADRQADRQPDRQPATGNISWPGRIPLLVKGEGLMNLTSYNTGEIQVIDPRRPKIDEGKITLISSRPGLEAIDISRKARIGRK